MPKNPARHIKRFIPKAPGFIPRPGSFRHPIRKAVRENTAGGVVWREGEKGVELLMIQDSKNRWTIPKGHVEKGERLEETAVREIQEETGLEDLRVFEKLDRVKFQYRIEDRLILMTMYVFLIKATGRTDKLVKEDWMNDIRWFSPQEALENIEYEGIGKLLLIALRKIRSGQYRTT